MELENLKWAPIEDIPNNWQTLNTPELEYLPALWKEQSTKLKSGSGSALEDFNAQLCRQWAIETGIIENLYSLERGITQLLVQRGLEASLIPYGSTNKDPNELVAILNDQKHALDGLFDFVTHKRSLSSSYIKELHQSFTRHQNTIQAITQNGSYIETKLLKGDWKRQPNNPRRPDGLIHEYCPPEQVSSQIDQLLKWHLEHIERKVPIEIEAAWLHHRFTQIHPFQDGNGRVARALATLVFIRANWFPLVIDRDNREEYITALEKADAGNLGPLVKLFSRIQKKAFLKALSISDTILNRHEALDQILASVDEKFIVRKELEYKEREKVFDTAEALKLEVLKKCEPVCERINRVIKSHNIEFHSWTVASYDSNYYWYRKEIVEIAKKLDYFAQNRPYSSWVKLKIKTVRETEILISFHCLGYEFLGLMGASAFINHKDISEGKPTVEGPFLSCQEVFEFSYNEPLDEIKHRFELWIDEAILMGLDHWRKQI